MAPFPPSLYPAQGSAADDGNPSAENAECLIAPTLCTDGVGRALLLYQRMVMSGFYCSQVLTGT
ncbi:MAG TPA: hypothetical protein PLI31_00860 [Methanoregulaceae archaeon]|nr:hypothetical protein [Methanoregulaceae archaeon]